MDTDYRYKISNIGVVYEDDWLLVLDKPPGLLSIPSPKKESRTLTSILNEDLKHKGVSYRLHPCHRLDRETSGLIIYAKGKSAQKKMMDEFRERIVKKTYIAFVQGIPRENQAQIQSPIEGQNALTKYKVIEKRKNFAIVEASPLTGRANQLRIHFKAIGHPIVGESKFSFRKDFKLKFKRLCLHASRLDFIHPVSGKEIRLKVDLAEDLKKFLNAND